MLLRQAGEELNRRGIPCAPARFRVRAGYVNGAGARQNRILGIGVSAKRSLHQLFERIDPYIKHEGRRRDMIRAWTAIASRYR